MIGKRTNICPPCAAKQRATYAAYAKRAQYRMTKQKKKPVVWLWELGERTGMVEAFTRSEAKARVKEVLDVKKLPAEVTIVARA